MIAAALLFAGLASASTYSEGLAAFDRGQLDEAEAHWRALHDAGAPSAAVERGLGWIAWRREDPALALAHWRAAARLKPRNDDIQHDLALARAAVERVPAPVGEPVWWMSAFTVVELAVGGALSLAAASGLALRWRLGRLGWLAPAIMGLVGFLLAGAAWHGHHEASARPVVVVVGEPAVAREAARPDAPERAVFPPGAELRVERVVGDFQLVRASNGKGGWIPVRGSFQVGPKLGAR